MYFKKKNISVTHLICLLLTPAPRIFPIAYNLVKPFLNEDTKKKMSILGSNWKEKLLEKIDADQVPVHWGGSQMGTDGDEFCKNKVSLIN